MVGCDGLRCLRPVRGAGPVAPHAWAAPFAVACAGFAGMLFEIVILFAFQVLHGTLYAEVGLIVAAMGGLALGAARRIAYGYGERQMADGKWLVANRTWQAANGWWGNFHERR